MDLFTIFAQIINFLILVALLKHFLYGPVVTAMDRREQRITARLESAQTREAEAAAAAEGFRRQSEALAAERAQALSRIDRESEERRRQLLEQARQEVVAAKARWFTALEQEKQGFLKQLGQRAGRELYQITEQAWADLAGAGLEPAIIATFIERLHQLPETERQLIARWAEAAQRPPVVFSSFELPPDLRQQLSQEFARLAGREPAFDFQLSPAVLAGIEIRLDGYKIGWSLGSYLRSLERGLSAELEERLPAGVELEGVAGNDRG